MSERSLIAALLRARKAGLLRLRPADNSVEFECLMDECGLCCEILARHISVTQDEAERLGSDVVHFGRNPIIKSKDGICVLYSQGLCTRHPDRPQGCREYPFYNIDGKLFVDVGCPGISRAGQRNTYSEESLPATGIEPARRFFSKLGPRGQDFVLWLLQRW